MAELHKKKRPGHRDRAPRHAKLKGAGPGSSTKTRPDVPSDKVRVRALTHSLGQ